jgi:tRNA 2-selenouridine synthase
MSSPEVVQTADAATLARFDLVIDVRSPSEFAEDHIPGAVNLPVLEDAERAQVGTIYVQESRFTARRLGAAYVARNVARHLETALADKPGAFRPLLYCWRGGMRSNAMAQILAQVGWRTSVLAGGYRTYRREVTARLYDAEPSLRVVLLDGGTGTGKTEVLARLAARGLQVLDLEGLAEHRGSLLGGLPGREQPSQKLFESRLLAAIAALDRGRPVVIEAESSKVGERMIPPALWQSMTAAPRIVLNASAPTRARYLAQAYGDLGADVDALKATLLRLPSRPGRRQVEEWLRFVEDGESEALAAALIEQHYDPAYRRSSRKQPHAVLGDITLEDLDDAALERAAADIERMLSGLRSTPAEI